MTPQWADALERANIARLAHAALKRELKEGCTTFPQALIDPRAETMTVFALLMAQRRWGRQRSLKFLRSVVVGETKYVGDLTERQMRRLVTTFENGVY